MAAVAILSLEACSRSAADAIDYNTAQDTPVFGWKSTDTLYYPIQVTSPASIRTPIEVGIPYHIICGIRMAASFDMMRVPMMLIVQQTDTLEGHTVIVRNLLRQPIAPAVRDSVGRPLGSHWGSYIDHEASLPADLTLRFDSIGNYRMMLTPIIPGLPSLQGISSVSLSLRRSPNGTL